MDEHCRGEDEDSLQQAEAPDDLIENLDTLRMNLQQMKFDIQVKQIECNAIRNVLNEKSRENSLLKEEKKYFIEKLAKMERDKQEQSSIVQITRKQSVPFTPHPQEVDLVHSTLTEVDIKIQQLVDNEITHMNKQLELEREIKLLQQKSVQLKSSEQSQQTNAEQINLDSKRSTHERDLAIVEKRQSEDGIQFYRQKLIEFEKHEQQSVSELERLHTHLLNMEESYINDLIAAEDREKSLRNELAQLKDCNQKQNEIIQQFKTSGEQSKQTLTTELGTLTLSSRCDPPVPHETL